MPGVEGTDASKTCPKFEAILRTPNPETTDYLTMRLLENGHDRILTIDASTRAHRMPLVRANFDASHPVEEKAIAKLQAFHTALGEDSQIYSTDEEVDTFGLFDSTLEEGKDEALALLMELRKFRKENPERFREIRNLPLRARCGRKDRHRAGATITFTRNKRRDAFYYLQPDGSCEELSFVEAARIFHAVAAEKSFPLHENHHAQVNTACETFRDALLKILHGFPLQKDEEEPRTPAITGLSTAELSPDIILSESFDYPEKGTAIGVPLGY